MLAKDLAAHRQAQAGALRALGRDEQREDLGQRLGRHAGAVVGDGDPRDAGLAVGGGGDRHRGVLPALDGIERVGDHVEHRPRHARGIEEHEREIGGRPPVDRGSQFGRPLLHRLDDVVDQGREVGWQRVGLPLLAEGEHVHHQRRDLVLVAADDVPALAEHPEVFVLQAHLHEVAAAADSLEDVLDVVGERGDGLARGREPLRLHHRGVVGGVLDGEGRLVADRDHQLEVVVAEPPLSLVGRLDQGRGRVDVDQPDGVVAAPHRHADRLPHPRAHHAVAGGEPVVLLGVAGQHALVVVEHVVEDRAADLHRGGVSRLAVATGLGPQFPALGIEQHDAAAVGFDPFEDELEDPAEKLVDVERVAHRQRRAIHHLEIAAGSGEPAVLRLLRGGEHDRVVLAHRPHDPGAVAGLGGGHDVHGREHLGIVPVLGIDQHGPAEADAVAAGELQPLDAGVVDERPVGTLEVAEHVGVAHPANLGMPPGDLVVVHLHRVARLAADADRPLVGLEVEAGAAVAALDDEQRRHGGVVRDGRGNGDSDSRTGSKPLEARLGRSRWRRRGGSPGGDPQVENLRPLSGRTERLKPCGPFPEGPRGAKPVGFPPRSCP